MHLRDRKLSLGHADTSRRSQTTYGLAISQVRSTIARKFFARKDLIHLISVGFSSFLLSNVDQFPLKRR
jgi:hypothetical protein